MTLYHQLNNDGTHDDFLYYMHLVTWGQNVLLWFMTLIFDSELMRMFYFRSSYLPSIIPIVGMPIYLLWHIFYHITAEYDAHTNVYIYVTFIIWLAFTFSTSYYTRIIIPPIYNYWMLLVE